MEWMCSESITCYSEKKSEMLIEVIKNDNTPKCCLCGVIFSLGKSILAFNFLYGEKGTFWSERLEFVVVWPHRFLCQCMAFPSGSTKRPILVSGAFLLQVSAVFITPWPFLLQKVERLSRMKKQISIILHEPLEFPSVFEFQGSLSFCKTLAAQRRSCIGIVVKTLHSWLEGYGYESR